MKFYQSSLLNNLMRSNFRNNNTIFLKRMNIMKILIIGSAGMAGHLITRHLSKKGYEVSTLSRKNINNPDVHKHIIANVSHLNREELGTIVGEYDAVINAVGILNENTEDDKGEAIYINSYFPHLLVDLTKDIQTKIIHLSTDCVFTGEQGLYDEDSFPDETSLYGRTKALGEIINDKDLTFRTSIIGPDMNPNGIGLINWYMKQKGIIQGYKNVLWTGVTTLSLAEAIDVALKEDLTGLYHLVNNQVISKLDLLNLFLEHFDASVLKVEPIEAPISDKSLTNNRTDFSYQVKSYDDMITRLNEWMKQNSNLYPHYERPFC